MDNHKIIKASVVNVSFFSGSQNVIELTLWAPEFKKLNTAGRIMFLEPLNKEDKPLWRPFSVTKNENGHMKFYIKVMPGEDTNTYLYSRLTSGESLKVSGPRGKRFILLPGISKYILVAGGIGQAAIWSIIPDIVDEKNKIELCVGLKDYKDLILPYRHVNKESPYDLRPKVIVEEKEKGFVTELLEESLKKNENPNTVVIACGPPLMLDSTNKLCEKYNMPCHVIVEKKMGCRGNGSCNGCSVDMKDGTNKLACKEGLMFNGKDVDWSKLVQSKPPMIKFFRNRQRHQIENRLQVTIGNGDRKLVLSSPIMISSGTMSAEEVLQRAKEKNGLKGVGAYIPKTIFINPRNGNSSPRISEARGRGILNAIGMPGIGIEEFVSKVLPSLKLLKFEYGIKIIASIAGDSLAEYGELAKILSQCDVADAIEVNISCPNVSQGGVLFGSNPKTTGEVTSLVVREANDKPVIIKLTPNITDITPIGRSAKEAGANALSLINTLYGTDIDINTWQPVIYNNFGGYSGSPILPHALYHVYKMHQANLGIPLIGGGGIIRGFDIAKFILFGCTGVQIGTEHFINPNVDEECAEELTGYLKERNMCCQELVGQAMLFEKK